MIGSLLPPGVVAYEEFSDLPGEPPFPGEQALIAKAVEGRRREFITARRCARRALADLGHPPAPILSGTRREPLWPAGISGSITHCAGYRAAAVAPARHLAGLGVDAEPNGPLPDGVEESVAAAGEREQLRALSVGIFALEHLMAESAQDHPTAAEGLAAFVRERTRDLTRDPPCDPERTRN